MTFSYGYVLLAFLNGNKSSRLIWKGQIYCYFYCSSLRRPQWRPRLTDRVQQVEDSPVPKSFAAQSVTRQKGRLDDQVGCNFFRCDSGARTGPRPPWLPRQCSQGTTLLPNFMFLPLEEQMENLISCWR